MNWNLILELSSSSIGGFMEKSETIMVTFLLVIEANDGSRIQIGPQLQCTGVLCGAVWIVMV